MKTGPSAGSNPGLETQVERPKRLNWGCGHHIAPGWINSDMKTHLGIDLPADILLGLPIASDNLDYVVSVHALPEIQYHDLTKALGELRRVLKPGGVLRLALPDLDKGIRAYLEGDQNYFLIPDVDARSIGSKFVTQMLWYGYSRTLFTADFIEELLLKAGFTSIEHCAFKETMSAFPEIVELDNRENESLFVEAVK